MFNQSKDGIFQITRGDSGFIYCINNKEEEIPTVKLYDTSDATATASDIVNGKTAYTADGKVEGTFKPDVAGKIVSGTAVNLTADDLYGATQIRESKFVRDTNLQTIECPPTLTVIGQFAFSSCTKLREIIFNDGLTTIYSNAFGSCSALEEVNLPDSVTYIGNDSFSYCGALKNVKIGNGISIVENHAFSYNTSLKTIDVGTGVTELYPWAFGGCSALQYIIMRPINPPIMSSTSSLTSTNNCPIYVPNNSVDTYKTATNWTTVASRIHPLSEIEGA